MLWKKTKKLGQTEVAKNGKRKESKCAQDSRNSGDFYSMELPDVFQRNDFSWANNENCLQFTSAQIENKEREKQYTRVLRRVKVEVRSMNKWSSAQDRWQRQCRAIIQPPTSAFEWFGCTYAFRSLHFHNFFALLGVVDIVVSFVDRFAVDCISTNRLHSIALCLSASVCVCSS